MGQEDDLMAYTRRLMRTAEPRVAISVDLSAVFGFNADPKRIRFHQSVIRDMAARSSGDAFVMRTGDMAIVVPPGASQAGQSLVDDMVDMISKDASISTDTLRRRIMVYAMPEEFWEFRSWIGRYVGGGSLAPSSGSRAAPAIGPDSDEGLQGRMTAAMLSRIEQRILRCDIREYVRQQAVCRRPLVPKDKWRPVVQERFLGIEALRSRFFPKVELVKHGPLFQEFCLILDERLIHHLLANRLDVDVKTSLNISIDSALAPMIDLLGKRIDDAPRGQLMFEIACVEFLSDIARGRRAVSRLRDNGFGVILDGLNFDLLPYLRLDRVDCDLLKVQFTRDNTQALANEQSVKALKDLPAEKIVFTRCDHEGALDVGAMLGVGLYQGWLIDRLCAF